MAELFVPLVHRPQPRAIPLRLENRRLPLAGKILEGVGVEQSLVELATLLAAHLGERRVRDGGPDSATQLWARHRLRTDQISRT